MPTTLAGRARAALLALTVPLLLALSGCNQNVNTPSAPSAGDAAHAGQDAANTGFDKVTDWSTSYPKFIAGLIVFLLVLFFFRKLIGNSTVRVLLAFVAGCMIVYLTMKG